MRLSEPLQQGQQPTGRSGGPSYSMPPPYYAAGRRFSSPTRLCHDILKMMPVFFVLLLMVLLALVFLVYHAVPLLQLGLGHKERNHSRWAWGIVDCVLFAVLFSMIMVNYALAIIVPAGGIPETAAWRFDPLEEAPAVPMIETKRLGGQRNCKWCLKFKPDRAHHCRVCRACVLKMDHHCPWIYNCVGWGNHKYFMLLLLYCNITLHYCFWRLLWTVVDSVQRERTPFGQLFLLFFGETLTGFCALLLTGFFIFHIVLMVRNETTVEYSERAFRHTVPAQSFSKGCWGNFLEVFGPSPFLWFLPYDNRVGDGLVFVSTKFAATTAAEDEAPHAAGHSAGGQRHADDDGDDGDDVSVLIGTEPEPEDRLI
eukprot:GHVU01149990.1.p1 GENE.GHVU01149990.1~~GHVU01149990.1.p1  ORF type:complete len:369 (+),score=73.46 GHVU01149990.1:700-1806(+)